MVAPGHPGARWPGMGMRTCLTDSPWPKTYLVRQQAGTLARLVPFRWQVFQAA